MIFEIIFSDDFWRSNLAGRCCDETERNSSVLPSLNDLRLDLILTFMGKSREDGRSCRLELLESDFFQDRRGL